MAAVGADSGQEVQGRSRGRVRYQDPETTKPREPTVAEQRARREAQRRERAQRDAAEAAEARKKKVRKRVLVGGGVAVGVVALVAIVYAASQPDEVEAQCVDPQGVVVPDENCGGSQQGGYYNSSGVFVPIFIGGFGNQYHYNYGSRSPVGTVAPGRDDGAAGGRHQRAQRHLGQLAGVDLEQRHGQPWRPGRRRQLQRHQRLVGQLEQQRGQQLQRQLVVAVRQDQGRAARDR